MRDLGFALYNEYKYRYSKQHKSGEVILQLATPNLLDNGITKRPQAMSLEYQELDVVKAYRNYYKSEQGHLLKYTKRDIPEWLVS